MTNFIKNIVNSIWMPQKDIQPVTIKELEDMERAVPKPWKVLMIEDYERDRSEIATHLEEAGFRVVGRVTTQANAVKIMRECNPDIILIEDGIYGRMDSFIEKLDLHRRSILIPVILMKSTNDIINMVGGSITNDTKPSEIIRRIKKAYEYSQETLNLENDKSIRIDEVTTREVKLKKLNSAIIDSIEKLDRIKAEVKKIESLKKQWQLASTSIEDKVEEINNYFDDLDGYLDDDLI